MDDALQTFLQEYAAYGYPVLVVGVLLENAGIPVPGETAVLVAGFLASPGGGGHFFLPAVVLLTCAAAMVGDNLGFWLGYRFARPYLVKGRRFLVLTPRTLESSQAYFARYGLWTIFFARFITGVRVFGALAAGTAGMPWLRFLAANAAGAFAWALTMSLVGYFFGHSLQLIERWFGRVGVGLLIAFVVAIMGAYVLRTYRGKGP